MEHRVVGTFAQRTPGGTIRYFGLCTCGHRAKPKYIKGYAEAAIRAHVNDKNKGK